MKNKIILLFINFFSIMFLYSCLTYGRPESIFVNFVGRDIENFVEYKKEGKISIENMNLNIIYRKNILVEMGPPERPTKGKYQISHLVLRNLLTSEEIIIHERIVVEKLLLDINNKQILYTFKERQRNSNLNYLIIYDLENKNIIDKIMILDDIKYKNEDLWLGGGGYISKMFFDERNNFIVFVFNYRTNGVKYDGYDYYLLNLNSREVVEILENEYKEIINTLEISENNFIYNYDGNTKHLFSIFPYSNYLPDNYKHKYNGTYINDGINNIRISKIETSYSGYSPLWLENGQYVIYGSYIFDTSGKRKEVKIIDGNIYAVF